MVNLLASLNAVHPFYGAMGRSVGRLFDCSTRGYLSKWDTADSPNVVSNNLLLSHKSVTDHALAVRSLSSFV